MGVNKHLTHVEELVLTKGNDGAQEALSMLEQVGKTLSPSGGAAVTITTKWDGAPAVVCGIDPADGQFFVGTKGVFAQQPKLAKTQSDVQRLYDGALAQKLSACLTYLKPVVRKGILQGDLLFTNDKSFEQIDGKGYITFRPNTLTYAADPDSKIGKEIQSAEVGIVFHTKYTGPSLQQLNAQFGVTDRDYNKTPNVWATSATFTNVGGQATFTVDEYRVFEAAVRQAKGSVSKAGQVFNKIQSGKKALELDTVLLQFFNSFYRGAQGLPSTTAAYNQFLHYLAGQYNTQIQKNKTLETQAKKAFKYVEAIDFIQQNQQGMQMLMATYLNITKAKNILVQKLNRVSQLPTFVETDKGYRVTAPEGFVAISGGNAVKLVDRLEFSTLNFVTPKKW